jgi:transposase
LGGDDPNPDRHQVFDLPKIEPVVTEYEVHTLGCKCGAHTKGELPKGAPRGSFGPTVVATIALMLGVWGLSRRAVVDAMRELFGLPISLGGVVGCQKIACSAMKAPYEQAVEQVESAAVKYADETGWTERNVYKCLWTVVTSKVTVFQIHAERSRNAAMQLLKTVVGILVSDRYCAYDNWPTHLRQFCWAHLARLFVKWSERPGEVAKIGRDLIEQKDLLFTWWRRVRDGTMQRSTFQRHVRQLRKRVIALLLSAAESSCDKTRRTALRLLENQHALFTFAWAEGVDPTNNIAERALRWAVILRKTSFGTQSEHGSRFIERMLTVHSTLRQHGKNTYAYIIAGCRDHMAGRPVSNLIAACGS